MKKLLSVIFAIAMLCGMSAQAFTYPEPDWGALLDEKKKLV